MRLRYWIKQGLTITGSIIAACIFYTVLMAFMNDELIWEDLLTIAGGYMVLFGATLSMALFINLYSLHLPLVLSFGSTRREVLLGLHCYRLLSIVILVTASTILLTLGGSFGLAPGALILSCSGIFLFFHTLGSILGILYAKFGKAALAFLIVFALLFLGGLAGLVIVGRGGAQIPDFIHWIILGIGVLTYALMVIPESRTIRNYNVKL